MGKDKKNDVNFRSIFHIAILSLFLLTVTAINILRLNSNTVSETEKRNLAAFPEINNETILSGQFAQRFDLFINDRFLFRDDLVLIGSNLQNLRGLSNSETVQLVQLDNTNVERELNPGSENSIESDNTSTVEATIVQTSQSGNLSTEPQTMEQVLEEASENIETPAEEQSEHLAAAGQQFINEILIIGERAMEVPGFYRPTVQYYADAIKTFVSKLDESIAINLMLGPSRIILEDSQDITSLGADLNTSFYFVYDQLPSQITTINPINTLRSYRDEYIYFNTDHHWTARGAYYAYRQYAISSGKVPSMLSQFETTSVNDFRGSLFLQTLSPKLRSNPDTIEIFLPYLENTYTTYWKPEGKEVDIIDLEYAEDQNKYQVFISSDSPLAIVKTELDIEDILVVVKDSYGNAFVPFLIPHFKEIHIVDPRYFEQNIIDYITEIGANEVLFINSYAVIAEAYGYARNINRVVNLGKEDESSTESGQ